MLLRLMRLPFPVLCLLGAGLICIVSCGKPASESQRQETPEPPLATIDPTHSATLSGHVRFAALQPEMPVIDFSSNPQCEREHMKGGRQIPQRAETVIVNPNHTLRNTLVWISAGLPIARWTPPAETAKLDQNGCMYRPHVLAIMVNQDLEILNSDSVNHNVHAEASTNEPFNEAEHPRAETLHKRFDKQEVWFPMTCSVHPWMRSYVAVIAHPFFAVTGDDGSYTLRGVPPGAYTLETVHEKYGRKQQRIIVGSLEQKTVDFEYAQ